MRHWLNSLSRLPHKLRRASRHQQYERQRARRLFLEPLEDRRMLTTTVSLEMEDGEALEGHADNRAVLKITRDTLDPSEPLTIGLWVDTSTATSDDYLLEDAAGSAFTDQEEVTIPADETELTFYVRAIGDSSLEGNESLVVTLIADPGSPPAFELDVDTQTVTLLDNGPPVASADAYSTDEDTELVVSAPGLVQNDTNVEADPLTMELVSDVSYGTLTFNADGSFSYLPAANFHGEDSFTYRLSDGWWTSDPVTVTITVNSVNDPPVAVADAYSTDEDTELVVLAPGLTDNDTDIELDPLTVELVSDVSYGTLTLNVDGSFSYLPAANFYGTDSFTYLASDGAAQSAPVTVTITVNSVNDPPVFASAQYDFTVAENLPAETLFDSLPASDADVGDTLTYALSGDGAELFTVDAAGQIALASGAALNYETSTSYWLTVGATDGLAWAYATVAIAVTNVNETPAFSPTEYQFWLDENSPSETQVGSVSAIDPDAGTTLVFTITGGSGAALFEIDASGQLTVAEVAQLDYEATPAYDLTIEATDGTFIAQASVTIHLNDIYENAPPAFDPASFSFSVAEESAAPTAVGTVTASDPEGAALSFAIVAGNDDANFAIDPETGEITVASGAVLDYETTSGYTLTVEVSDGTRTAEAEVAIVVLDIIENRPPVFDPEEYQFVLDETSPGETLVGQVLATDPDFGDSLAYAILAGDPDGLFLIDAEGNITLAPEAQLDHETTASYTLTVEVSDGELTDEATVVVIVDDVQENLPPTAQDDEYQVPYLPALGLSVFTLANPGILANDSDPDGDPLEVILLISPSHGSLAWSPEGGFIYTAGVGFAGTDYFSYRLTDGELFSNTATVTLTVTGDAAPVFDPASYEFQVAENSPAATEVGTVVATDADGETLAFSILDGNESGYFVIDGATGAITVAEGAELDYEATHHYTLTIQADDGLLQATATVEIAVTNVVENTPPVFDPASYAFEIAENSPAETAVGTVVAADPEGEPLTFTIVSGNDLGHFIIDPASGLIAVESGAKLDYETTAAYELVVRASDGVFTATATVAITVTDVYENNAPTTNDDLFEVEEDNLLEVPAAGVLENDSDLDEDTIWAILVSTTAHGLLTLNVDGSFTYSPDDDFYGTDAFTYQANDGIESSNVATVTISVLPLNDAPVAVDDSFSLNEDESLVVSAPGVLAGDVDIEGDLLVATLVLGPAHGMLILNPDGSFSYKPDSNYFGDDSFTYTANDASLPSAEATVTLYVNPVNDAPVAWSDALATDEDQALTFQASDLTNNDSDADGDGLTVNLVSSPSHGLLSENADGSFTYTPDSNYFGDDSFAYQVDDGALPSEVTAVTITVNPVNDAPVAGDDADLSVPQNTTLSVTATGVLWNDIDVDGDALTAIVGTEPSHGTLTLSPDGSFEYTPTAGYVGLDSFTYWANDGTTDSNAATVTINITNVNDGPIATDDSYFTDEDSPLTVIAAGVLTNDTDPDDDPLAASLVSDPMHGSVVLNTDGSFIYTPDDDFSGEDGFTYTATDPSGAASTAWVFITVGPVNDPPVATDNSYELVEDEGLFVSAPGVLAGDTDVDGDSLTAALVSGPAHGTLSLNPDGSFTYSPDSNYFGDDSFTYTANDGSLSSAEATVTLHVNPVNDAPVGVENSYPVDEDTTLVVVVPGILANDTDAEGDPLTVSLVSDVGHGTLLLQPDGSFSYEPFLNFFGLDSFVYQTSDGLAASAPTIVLLEVRPINDAPEAVGETYSVNEDETLFVDAPGLLTGDGDVDGDPLTAAIYTFPSHGALNINADGSFTYTPEAGFHGEDSFVYQASDGALVALATVYITVAHVNHAPLAVDDSYTIDEDLTLTVDSTAGVLLNDSDPDDDALAVSLVIGPASGSLSLNPDGSFSYTPNAGFSGTDGFTYQVTDGSAFYVTGSVTIGVNPVNDPPEFELDEYGFSVPETAAIDFEVGTVVALDPELGVLTFEIIAGNEANQFAIGPLGQILVTASLDYETTASYTLTVLVTDDGGLSDTTTVTIEVVNENELPTANDDFFNVPFDRGLGRGILVIADPGVLANDSDPDGDPLVTDGIAVQPAHGWVVLNPSGSFTYFGESEYLGSDSFTYTVSDGNGGTSTAIVNLEIVAESNSVLPIVEVLVVDPLATEAGTDSGQLVVTRTGPTDRDLTVNLVVGGTAVETVDYAPIGATIVIPAGSNSAVVDISPVNDAEVELYEFVSLSVVPGFEYQLGANNSSVVSIIDDEVCGVVSTPPLTVSVSNSSVIEGGQLHFVISLSSASTQVVTVQYATSNGSATAGEDYLALHDLATFPPGSTTFVVDVPTIDDAEFEGTEHFTINLSNSPRARILDGQGVGKIIENDDPLPVLAEVEITSFYSDGTDLFVDYMVSGDIEGQIKIGIYGSIGGSELDARLEYLEADASPGAHTLHIAPTFDDSERDYLLVAKVDSDDEIAEEDESNNTAVFAGGAFVVNELIGGEAILHFHGGADDDYVHAYANPWEPGRLSIVTGRMLPPLPPGTSPPAYYDYDGDGMVTYTDAAALAYNRTNASRPWHNPNLRSDVNGDGVVSPLDLLEIYSASQIYDTTLLIGIDFHPTRGWLDVTGDNVFSLADLRQLVLDLQTTSSGGAGEGDPSGSWQNQANPADVNNDGQVNSQDDAAINNFLGASGPGAAHSYAVPISKVHVRTHQGNDRAQVAGASSWMFGGPDNDWLKGASVPLNPLGGSADDLINGGDGDDTIDSGGGDDQVDGGLGNDDVRSGPGNDDVMESPGIDQHSDPSLTAFDQTLSMLKNTQLDITLSAIAPAGSILVFSSDDPSVGVFVSVSGSNLTYEPPTDWIGTAVFTFFVTMGDTVSNVATVTITVEDGLPPNTTRPKIRVDDAKVIEGGILQFRVSVDPHPTTVMVDYSTADGSAKQHRPPQLYDYQQTTGTLVFSPSQNELFVEVPTRDDSEIEGAELLQLKLSNLVNAEWGDDLATGVIEDNDFPPSTLADIELVSFYSDGTDRFVKYRNHVPAGASWGAFRIAIYASPDGVAIGSLPPLQSVTIVNPTAGEFTLLIPASFRDPKSDYFLLAKAERIATFAEASETNNSALFVGGSFIANDPLGKVLHIHGQSVGDNLGIGINQLSPTMLRLSNGRTFATISPAGTDTYYDYDGDGRATPVDARAIEYNLSHTERPWRNPGLRADVNGDLTVNSFDILAVTNAIIAFGTTFLADAPFNRSYGWLDVNGDNVLSSADLARVVVDMVAGTSAPIPSDLYRWRNSTLPGDVNGDGLVTPADVSAIQAYLGAANYGGLRDYSIVDRVHVRSHQGNDRVGVSGKPSWIFGGPGDDQLAGSTYTGIIPLNWQFNPGLFNDEIYGGDGNDELYGQDGNDTLNGEAGNNRVYGGSGADLFQGGSGDQKFDNYITADWQYLTTSAASGLVNIMLTARYDTTPGAGLTFSYGRARYGAIAGPAPALQYFSSPSYIGLDHFEFWALNPSHTFSSNTGVVQIDDRTTNLAPTLNNISSLTINEDAPEQIVPLTGISAGPGERQRITVSASSGSALIPDLRVVYTSPNSSGELRFTPPANANGTASISVEVMDELGSKVTKSFNVTIQAVNDPPVAQQPATAQVDEDSTTGVLIPLVGDDGDPELVQPLAVKIVSLPGFGQLRNVAGTVLAVGDTVSNPNLRYIPAPNHFGWDQFDFLFTENTTGNPALSGTYLDSAPKTAGINTHPMNDPPAIERPIIPPVSLSPAGAILVNEDSSFGLGALGLRVNDNVDDPAPANSYLFGVVIIAQHGTVTVNYSDLVEFETGQANQTEIRFKGPLPFVNAVLSTLAFTPPLNYPGTELEGPATVTVTANDRGHRGAGGPLTDEEVFQFVVRAVNDPPVNHLPGLADRPNFELAVRVGETLPIKGLSFTDIDARPHDNFTVTLELDPGEGEITVHDAQGWQQTLTFANKTRNQLLDILDKLVYRPAVNAAPGVVTLRMTTNDLGHTGGPPLSDVDDLEIIIHNQPLVRIKATDAHAHEVGLDNGKFTISRIVRSEGDPKPELRVRYEVLLNVTKAATPGTDYHALHPLLAVEGEVTIPANADSTTLDVIPMTDALEEGDEYVTVQLLPGEKESPNDLLRPYYVDPRRYRDTVTIHEAPEPPEVTVVATDAYAAEDDADMPTDDGVVTFSRGEGNTTGNLTLHFKFTDATTAALGADFASDAVPSGLGPNRYIVTIPSGKSSADVRFTIANDQTSEWDELIEVQLLPDPNVYSQGPYPTVELGSEYTSYSEIDDDDTGSYDPPNTDQGPSLPSYQPAAGHDKADVTVFDDDGVEGLLNRNIDQDSTSLVRELLTNGTVGVDAYQGQVVFGISLPGSVGPTYRGDDNSHPILPVEWKVPGGVVPRSIEATTHFAHLTAGAQYGTADVTSAADPLRFVLPTSEAIVQTLRTGHYDYDLQFDVVLPDGTPKTRTIRGSTEIINTMSETVGDNEFGKRWRLDELDRLRPDDGMSARFTDEGRAAVGGLALIRGDNTSGLFVGNLTDYTVDDEPEFESSGQWQTGTYAGGHEGDYQLTTTADKATWRFQNLANNRQYQVFATWVPGIDRTANALYKVQAEPVGSAAASRTIPVDQRFTPGETQQGATVWRSLGFYTVDDGTLDVELLSGGSGQRIADAVMLVKDWNFETPLGSYTTLEHNAAGGGGGSGGGGDDQGQFTLKGKYGDRFEFDDQGLLTKYEDRNKNQVKYEYTDGDGDTIEDELSKITRQGGLETTFTYADRHVATIGYLGRTTTYNGSDGQITQIQLPNPNWESLEQPEFSFAYDGADELLSKVTDANTNETEIQYKDGTFRVKKVINADTHDWKIDPYLVDGFGTSDTPPKIRKPATGKIGNQAEGGNSSFREPKATYTDPRTNKWTYQTDVYGLYTALAKPETNSFTNVWKWNRRDDGLPSTYIQPEGSGGALGSDGFGGTLDSLPAQTTSYQYDDRGNLTELRLPLGITETWSYSSKSQVEQHLVTEGAGPNPQVAQKTVFVLDASHNVQKKQEFDGANVARETQFTYTSAPGSINDLPGGLVDVITVAANSQSDKVSTKAEYFASGSKVGLPQRIIAAYEQGSANLFATQLDYDSHRNLSTSTDPSGRETSYKFDDLDRLVQRKDPTPDGNADHRPRTKFYYDKMGNLVRTVDPRQQEVSTLYNKMGQPIKVTLPTAGGLSVPVGELPASDQSSNYTTYTYDANGNLSSETAAGRTVVHTYNARNERTETAYPAHSYSEFAATLPVEATQAPLVKFDYDNWGNLAWQSDPRNLVIGGSTVKTKFRYDELGRLVRQIQPSRATDLGDGEGHSNPTTWYIYDALGHVTSVSAPGVTLNSDLAQQITDFRYDALGRLDYELAPEDDNGYRIKTDYAYDLRDNPTEIKVSAPGSSLPEAITTSFFDKLDRLIGVDYPDGGAPAGFPGYASQGLATQYAYNLSSEVMAELTYVGALTAGSAFGPSQSDLEQLNQTLLAADTTSRLTTYLRDGLGRVWFVTGPDPDGTGPEGPVYEQYYYDENSNRTFTDVSYYSQGTFVLLTTAVEYDNLNRPFRVTGPSSGSGGPVEVTTYNLDGSVSAVAKYRPAPPTGMPAGTWAVTRFGYDSLGRQYLTISPNTDSGTPLKSYTATDAAGNVVLAVDPNGVETRFTYDLLNRMATQTQWVTNRAAGQVDSELKTTYKYYSNGQLRLTKDNVSADAGKTEYACDKAGRPTRVTRFNQGRVESSSTAYDGLGRPSYSTDPNQNLTRYKYDTLGRLVQESLAFGSGEAETLKTRSYAFDPFGNLRQTTDRNGRVVQYGYDNAGHRTSETWLSGGETVYAASFAVSPVGEILSVENARTPRDAASGNYETSSPVTVSTFAYSYYDNRRVSGVTRTLPEALPTKQFQLTYGYDAPGNVISRTLTEGSFQLTTMIGRDALGRTTEIAESGPSVISKGVLLTYDGTERDALIRLQNGLQIGYTEYSYGFQGGGTNKSAHLTELRHNSYSLQQEFGNINDPYFEEYSLRYDAAGRLASFTSQLDPGQNYSYDARDQLVQATSGGETTSYAYDPAGNQTGTPGPHNRLERDAFNEYAYDEEGNVTSRQTFALQRLVDIDYDNAIIDTSGGGPSYADEIHPELLPQDLPKGRYRIYIPSLLIESATFPADMTVEIALPGTGADPLEVSVKVVPDGTGKFRTVPAASSVFPTAHFVSTAPEIRFSVPGGQLVKIKGNVQIDLQAHTYFYRWDFHNRLEWVADHTFEATPTGGNMTLRSSTALTYDALGDLISKRKTWNASMAPEAEVYLPEAGTNLLQFDGAGSLQRHTFSGYAAAVDEILAVEDFTPDAESNPRDRVIWTYSDHNGTVRDLVVEGGGEGAYPAALGPTAHAPNYEHLRYDQYGARENGGDSEYLNKFVPYGHFGMAFNDASDTYLAGATVYEPHAGRLMNPTGSGENPYVFAGNSPTDRSHGISRQQRPSEEITTWGEFRPKLTWAAGQITAAGDAVGGWMENAGFAASDYTGWTGFAAIGGYQGTLWRMPFQFAALGVDLPTTIEGIGQAAVAGYHKGVDYYREGGGGLNGTLLAISGVSGVAQLSESGVGYDILTAEKLSGDERFDRAVSGLASAADVAALVAAPYTALKSGALRGARVAASADDVARLANRVDDVAPNSLVKLKPGGSTATSQFSRFKSPQRWINKVIEEHLSNVKLTYHPKYNGRLKDFGQAVLSLDPSVRKTTIGRKSLISAREMVDTIVHEELHHRLYDRWLRGSKRAEDIIDDIDYEEVYVEDVVHRYLRMKGLE